MPKKIRFCILCNRYDRTNRSNYTRIYTAEREAKLLEGYRRRNHAKELPQSMLHQMVHQKCYNKTVRGVVSTTTEPSAMEQTHASDIEEDDEQDQTSVIQSRSRMPIPSTMNKHLFERRQRICAVCNHYAYRAHNKMKQIVSNFTANKLAQGYAHVFKKPINQSLLDAYIHETCFRKLYSSYRYHAPTDCRTTNRAQHTFRPSYSPHETRSRSTLHQSSDPKQRSSNATLEDSADELIEELFSTPFSTSITKHNSNVELSARSCLFRPCIQRLTQEEIDFYTNRTLFTVKPIDATMIITDPLLINQPSTSIRNDPMLYSNQDDGDDDHNNHVNMNEQDRSPDWRPNYTLQPRLMCNQQQKICPAAKIRRRYPQSLVSPNPLLSDHTYIQPKPSSVPIDLEKLHEWLLEQFKSFGHPFSMGEVLGKYREFAEEENMFKGRESICRERLRHRLEKFYAHQFLFVTPNKREGTFIALNDINHHVRLAIKNAKREKEKAVEASILTPTVITPAPVDLTRQTCEEVMNAIRKIRLYIRDARQINSLPPLLIRNLIGLITSSEKQFDKISQHYDFYGMIDEDLFIANDKTSSNRTDKNLRIISLASDLINARHDHRVSEKHFLLADELITKSSQCTPKQLITLLNRYGHTCSYKSYMKMKTSRQQSTQELTEHILNDLGTIITIDDKSSDSEFDLI